MNKIYIGIITGDGLGSESLSDCKTFSNLTDCQDWLKGEFAGFSEDEDFESFSVDFDKSNRALYYSWSDEEEGDFLHGWIVEEKIN